MNIIRSAIIDPATDAFWNDATAITEALSVKPVLVLVSNYESGSNEEAQLVRMLHAADLSPDQYNIIQLQADQQIAWHKLREKTDPKAIFLVGIMPAQLGISSLFQVNIPNRFDGRYWLPTLSPSELEQQPEVKKHLWTNGVKPLFKDKTFGDIFA